ncbi:serine hydrolase [Marinospirillum sp.]|uniref:serine hydrolase domain-containing protein n=1 Tax=Marinospirillum sp. TaxID=2183934 RepID=UPI002870A4C2|nr:serine hydrolase [Marinospirillum sp.]MDR9469191.1 serine hydrolase [Marinospirillum sp.]
MITRRTFNQLALSGLALPFMPSAFGHSQPALDRAVRSLTRLHSIQVQLGDQVIYAQAPRGSGLDSFAYIKSCSKSLVALLLGSCIARDEIASVDRRLVQVAPKLIPADATEGVDKITLQDLVTLQAGLEGTSGPRYGAWVNSPNWIANALTRPQVAEPGQRMVYSTGTSHILGAVLTEASGQSLLQLARERLGNPLGFQIPPWVRDPQGYYLGGNGMALTPRAMLAIARLLRDKGQFEGQQVIPEDWIHASMIPRTQSPYSGLDYGYGWFISASGYVMARGYGGQIIAAHPEHKLAVAITSDPNTPAHSKGYFADLMELLDGPVLELVKAV